MKTVIFIPCKTSSKRIPYKNTRPFADSSLLQITIDFFKDFCEHDIYVSSEDDSVLSTASINACLCHKRSSDISHDSTTNFEVLNDFVNSFDITNAQIILAQPSHPMRFKVDLDIISKLPYDSNYVSVCSANAKYIASLSQPCPSTYPELYKVDGSYYILNSESIRLNKPFNLYPFLIPYPDKRVDVDHIDQFTLAESLYSIEHP